MVVFNQMGAVKHQRDHCFEYWWFDIISLSVESLLAFVIYGNEIAYVFCGAYLRGHTNTISSQLIFINLKLRI